MARLNRPSGWQRLVHRFVSSRPGARFASYALPRLDGLLLRLSHGRHSALSILGGLPLVSITLRGAKSGALRTVFLIGIPDGDKFFLIASNWGGPHHPAWYYNLRAHPQVTLSFQGRTGSFLARQVTGAEREAYWQRAVELYAGYTVYKQRARGREIPVIVLTPQTIDDLSDPLQSNQDRQREGADDEKGDEFVRPVGETQG